MTALDVLLARGTARFDPLRLSLVTASVGLAYASGFVLRHPLRVRGSAMRARLQMQLRGLGYPDLSGLILGTQGALLALAVLGLLFAAWWSAALSLVMAWVPQAWLARRAEQRLVALGAQVPAWLTSLAGVLRATPAIGEALTFSTRLCTDPLQRELERCCLDMRLGASVAEALEGMAQRVNSRALRNAVAVLRSGTRSGGEVPRTLDEAASSLRELARLEGVVRTRTAEARAQAGVVALAPFPTILLLASLDPQFLAPLFASARGAWVIAAAVCLWLISLFSMWRILRVDL